MDELYRDAAEPRTVTLVGLVGLAVAAVYVLALDQGWLLSLVQGARAVDLNLIHGAVHDARHVAGFPCH
jgi:cobalt transporter subunit CbtB